MSVGAFATLRRHVCRGDLAVLHIDAVPRSMSTILEIASAELADAQVNEPFNRGRCDLDAAAADVLRAAEAASERSALPAVVVTKSISSEIHAVFGDWVGACAGVVFAVRDPLVQLTSVIERISNDMFVGRGQARLSFFDLRPRAAEADALAARRNFYRPSWYELWLHFQRCAETPGFRWLVADGTMLCANPRPALRAVAEAIGRPYVDRAAHGWTRASRGRFNNVNHYESDYDSERISVNAWVRQANGTTSFEPDRRPPACLRYWQQWYPLSWRYLVEVALPVYGKLVQHAVGRHDTDRDSLAPAAAASLSFDAIPRVQCGPYHDGPCSLAPLPELLAAAPRSP